MKKEIIFSLISGTLISLAIFVLGGYAIIEPLEIDAATSTATTSVSLTVNEGISLTAPSAITMVAAIDQSNSTSSGGGAWNVKTNSQAGYTLSLNADDTNALDAAATGEYFTDCATTTPSVWTATGGCQNANNYIFGFSAYGTDVPAGTWGTGTSCGTTSTIPTNLNYRGFASTTLIQIASRNTETTPSGVDSTMCVAAEQGSNVYAPDGFYSTVITGTAVTL